MDAATAKQKIFIKHLFGKCGVPKWLFNPLKMWNISKEDADLLINSLKIMKECSHDDLRDAIWHCLEGKKALYKGPMTIDQIEEAYESFEFKDKDWVDDTFRPYQEKEVVL